MLGETPTQPRTNDVESSRPRLPWGVICPAGCASGAGAVTDSLESLAREDQVKARCASRSAGAWHWSAESATRKFGQQACAQAKNTATAFRPSIGMTYNADNFM